MSDIAETDLHWLAGLLEGEASFHLCRHRGGRQVYPVIRLKMCDLDVVEKASDLLGCTTKPRDVPPRSSKHKPQYIADVIGSRAIPWLHRLRPLMGQRRQQQIDDVLAGMTAINLNHKHCQKINREKAQEIRELWQQRTMTRFQIAALYGIHPDTVYSVVNGRIWRD